MSHFSVAGLQLEISNQDNLSMICDEIDAVVRRFPWLDMVFVGELATYGASAARAQPAGGVAEQAYREVAARNNIWLIPGSLYESEGENVYNTLPVINPAGEIVTRYRKVFPFAPYEAETTPGDGFVVFDVPDVGRIGVCICYDIWFPEVARSLVHMGAEAIICPTMTNTIDRDVEVCLSRSLTAVNQCYFFGLNVAGRLGVGRSIAVGPDADVIYEAGSGHEVITVDMDFERVRRSRERGVLGLCQTLKSFRDNKVSFPAYETGSGGSDAFDALGRLVVPARKLD